MNELLLFIHSILIIVFLLAATRLGKEALITFVVLLTIIANLFVLKQTELFHLHVTCADVYMIGGVLGMNLLQEFFGREVAKRTLWVTFFCMIFFTAMSQMHLWYSPSVYDSTQNSYQSILGASPRIFIASLTTFFIVQRVDIFGYGFLKNFFKNRYLPLRIVCSLLFSQLLDTVLFSYLGLYGIVERIPDIILVSFSIKVMIICFLSPFTQLSKRFVRT